MPLGPKGLFGAVIAAGTLWASLASALDAQTYDPASGTWNYLSVESSRTGPAGRIVPSLHLQYASDPLVLRTPDGDVVERVVENLVTLDLMAAYAVNAWLDVSMAVPFSRVSGEGMERRGQSEGFALNDIRMVPKATLLHPRSSGLGVAVVLPLILPTGDPQKHTSDDTLVIHPKIIGELELSRVRFAANFGARYRASNTKVDAFEAGSEITYAAATDVQTGVKPLHIIGELFGAVPVKEMGENRPIEALVGARYFTGWCGVFSLGAGTGIVADYGAPEYRLTSGFAWMCADQDRDGDGLLDNVDACPDDPEDRDGFEDANGCPDPDNDNDGVVDIHDQCPLDAEDADQFQDEDGCPDPDNDADGLLDVDDMCPIEAEDRDAYQDGDGCPDPDNDRDGRPDIDDMCPLEAEDIDTYRDEDGCPDPDNDNDGIPDVDDKCPLEAETENGVEDTDGCPDGIEPPPTITIVDNKIEMRERVFFDLGKATIKRRSHDVLTQFAATLKSHPEILRIRIEGHTDSSASPRINRPLSQRRADAVKRFLIDRGIDADRLQAMGYGSERPLVPHSRRGAASKNRRVDFVILSTRQD